MKRRTLLKYLTLSPLTLPFVLQANILSEKKHKRLILIELKGGNDSLNTVIPYSNPLYYKLRPKIAIDKNFVLPLNNQLALHPALHKLKDIFDNKELAIIQGVGYPEQNRSHFRSIEIWDTASDSNTYLSKGWLSSLSLSQKFLIKGVVLGGEYGPLSGSSKGVIKINNIQRFVQQSKQIQSQIYMTRNNDILTHILQTESDIIKSADVLKQYLRSNKPLNYKFKKSKFSNQLSIATQLINDGSNIPLLKISLDGFDTHVGQPKKHAKVLKELSDGIHTLRENLMQSGQWENTLIMTYSEFGRRVSENSNKGTDHGTAASHFILGGKVKGGIYGKSPSLETLDKNGDLIYTTDFRSIYKSVSRDWFNISCQRVENFSTLDIL